MLSQSVFCSSLQEAVARFEGLRVVLLHQCTLTLVEVIQLDDDNYGRGTLNAYALALEGAATGPRGQPTDVGDYHTPVRPQIDTYHAHHVSCTGRTAISITPMVDCDVDGWAVTLLKTNKLGSSPRDQGLGLCLSPAIGQKLRDLTHAYLSGAHPPTWAELLPESVHYKGMDHYFAEAGHAVVPGVYSAWPRQLWSAKS